MKTLLAALVLLLTLCWLVPAAHAAPAGRDLPPGLQIPDAARPGPQFDVDRATEAYLNLLSPEQRAQSDAYFEGGYWIRLWQLLYGFGVAAVLLFSGLSRRMRDLARRMTRWRWLQTTIYAILWLIAAFVLDFPATYYTDFVREHQYGLATQDF